MHYSMMEAPNHMSILMLLFNGGLMAQFKKIQVGVLNGKLKTLDVMPVELMVESLDGK